MAGCMREVMEPSGREKAAAAAALVAGLAGVWFMLAYSYVYINCAVFPVAGALIAYAYDVAERTVAARKEYCREVETRRAAGQTNQPPRSQTKTTGEIVRDNICTYFNLVFLVLAVMLALVRSWLNMGFLAIVFWNTLIGIVQQLRAKKTIDELTLVSARKVRCLRDGQWCEVLSDDLVRDDVVEFGAGDQIVADAVVLDGSAQANESLITGEARAVPKEAGGELRSGSFLMAGRCTARLPHVAR